MVTKSDCGASLSIHSIFSQSNFSCNYHHGQCSATNDRLKSENLCRALARTVSTTQSRCYIAPFILVILPCPRLIISFASGRMKSSGESWLFFAGYIVSYVPPILTFVVFVLLSKLCKDEFRKSVRHFRKTIQTRLHLFL